MVVYSVCLVPCTFGVLKMTPFKNYVNENNGDDTDGVIMGFLKLFLNELYTR